MKSRLLVWFSVLMLAGAALAGCSGSLEEDGGAQAQAAAVLKPAMLQALDALEAVAAKAKAGDAAGARQDYQTFAAALGKVLGPVSLKDPQVAQLMANANTAVKRTLATPQPDAALISEQAGKITTGMQQSAAMLGVPLVARVSAQTVTPVPAKTVELYARDYRFTPELIEVPKGTKLTIRLVNNGTKRHEWELDALNVEIKPVNPGAAGEITFMVAEAGRYEFVCRVDDHDKEGMRGFLVVK